MHILSVDFGTSSVKAAVLNKELDIVASAKVEYELRISENDKVELNPDEVFEAFIKCTQELGEYVKRVDIITFDNFSPSVIFMDGNGQPLSHIITHLDRRSRKQTEDILNIIGEDGFQSITGVLPFTGGVSATSILWIKENMPGIFNSACKAGHFNTYFYKKLTGVWAIDPVNASMMGLYETVKDTGWSKDICKALEIPIDKLPDIAPGGAVLGRLGKEIAAITGLREGIPVALGSNDAATAQVGADNVNAGDILNISGSSEILTVITDKPILNKKYYVRRAVTPGKWQIFATTAGGFAIEWFRNVAFMDMDISTFYQKYMPGIVKAGMEKTEVRFLPYLAGDRHSLEKKRGGFTGLTLGTKREDMLLAVLYGMHEPMINTMELAARFLQLSKTIKVTGGLSSNDYMLDFKKSLFPGYKFQTVDNCPILGNAKLALQSWNK